MKVKFPGNIQKNFEEYLETFSLFNWGNLREN